MILMFLFSYVYSYSFTLSCSLFFRCDLLTFLSGFLQPPYILHFPFNLQRKESVGLIPLPVLGRWLVFARLLHRHQTNGLLAGTNARSYRWTSLTPKIAWSCSSEQGVTKFPLGKMAGLKGAMTLCHFDEKI